MVLEQCLDTVLLSVSLVVAGSGNIQVLRVARRLHKRCSTDISYGKTMFSLFSGPNGADRSVLVSKGPKVGGGTRTLSEPSHPALLSHWQNPAYRRIFSDIRVAV